MLGRLKLANPILVASGTFGYAREMAGFVDLARLGGIIPKTITKLLRKGNAPWRTIETPAGMLNSIGLDNDGIDAFIANHLPYLARQQTAIIVSIAGRTHAEFVEMAAQLSPHAEVAAIELNISCPNVSGGVDFGTDAQMCERVVAACRESCVHPDHCQAHAERDQHRRHGQGCGSGRSRCDFADQHLPGDGHRLAASPAAARQHHRRPERSGDQADRPAMRLPGGPGRRHADHRHWRHRERSTT